MKIKDFQTESWSQKYKNSINCSHPRGFSQKAHCAGKKKHNESIEMEMVCEDCGMCQTHGNLNEIAKGQKDSNGYTRCWPGKHAEGTKKGKNGGQVRNCVPNESVEEAMFAPKGPRKFDPESAEFVITMDGKPHMTVKGHSKAMDALKILARQQSNHKWGVKSAAPAVMSEATRPIPVDDNGNRILPKQPSNEPVRPFGQPGDSKSSPKGVIKYTPTGIIHKSHHGDVTPRPRAVPEGLPQTLRKVVPGYAKREIDKKMDAGKFGKTDVDKDANFHRYKKIQDKLKEFAPAPNPGGGNYLKALASAWYNGTFNTGDLHKGIKSQEDVEKILARGIHCGDGQVRKYSIGYNANFDGVEIQSDDHYEYADSDDAGNDIDSRTGKPWGPYDVVAFHDRELDESVAEGHADQQRKIFKKNGKPVGEVGIDRESSPGNGQWYMKCYARNIDNAGYDSYEEAVAELKHCMKQGVAEGSEQVFKVIAVDKSNYLGGKEEMTVKADSIEDLFSRLSANDWYPLEINGVEVVAGKRLKQGVAEGYNPEYDDEAGMADNNLGTLRKAVDGIDELIQTGDNLPEWCQEKIAVAENMLVTVWNYMQGEQESDEDPEIAEMYEAMDQLAEEMAAKKGVSVDLVWETFESMDDNMLYETAAWRRKEGKSKKGGLNAKGVASYRREHPGSKLQTAVTTKPSKLKPGSKAAKRRKSFCARMGGVKGPMKKPNGKPTRKALALRKWNC
jgi:hypothetical protein